MVISQARRSPTMIFLHRILRFSVKLNEQLTKTKNVGELLSICVLKCNISNWWKLLPGQTSQVSQLGYPKIPKLPMVGNEPMNFKKNTLQKFFGM